MKPFRVEIPQAELDDLQQRLAQTRWPTELAGIGWERGVPLAELRELVEHWQHKFDWRQAEAELNKYPQYLAEIDGEPVHFLHIESPEPDALPLVLTHGWPGSVREFFDIIGPLTDPRAHGRPASDAFHLVIPSIPGYGFSSPLHQTGWDVPRIASAWNELMHQIGYQRYGAQGGDAGSPISLALGMMFPDSVVGVHVNMMMAFPSGDPAEFATLAEADLQRLGKLQEFDQQRSAYMKIMATRPQTVAYGLTDSPVGLLAWIAEKYHEWADTTDKAVSPDVILTVASIYWFTRTAGSSAHFYFEGAPAVAAAASGALPPPMQMPVGVAIFPHDIFVPVRSMAERAYPTISRWTEFDRGGHFAALEEPELLTADVQEFFRTVR